MLVVWCAMLVVGVVAAGVASRHAVAAALDCTDALGVSAGVVGLSIMAVGTDLPEIANSIVGSLSDHGDLIVGDSTGSSFTQVTLVLALLLLASASLSDAIREDWRVVATAGGATVAALLVVALVVSDGWFGRVDGLVLVAGWLASLVWFARKERRINPILLDDVVGPALLRTFGWLAVVGIAATAVVRSFVEITESIGVPEFVASAIVLALGTSLPELVVDWTAVRAGAAALAIGDLFGSSLVDATLAVGIGPSIHPTAVSSVAVPGTLIAATAVGLATVLVVSASTRLRLASGLFATYAAALAALIVIAR